MSVDAAAPDAEQAGFMRACVCMYRVNEAQPSWMRQISQRVVFV